MFDYKNIGVIGAGFVGTAIAEGMKHAFDVYSYDVKLGISINNDYSESEVRLRWMKNGIQWLKNVDGPIFICVPTPMQKDGSCDTSIVESAVDAAAQLPNIFDREIIRTIVIKSTVTPGTTERLNQKWKNKARITFNPEFLTEAAAVEDFKKMNRVVLGGDPEAVQFVKHAYDVAYPNVPVLETDSTTAEMVKYIANCFLATKVSFANEMKQICDKLKIDYNVAVAFAKHDQRLGNSHWAVPGPMPCSDGSGRLLPGFAGSCFSKDINAMIAKAEELGVDTKVLKAAWDKNIEVRPERDWELLIGRAVKKK